MQVNVSHAFQYTQSYRRLDELPAPDNFSRYTESSTVSKVNIEKANQLRIKNPLFMISDFKSKILLENPVQFAFILANENIEELYVDSFEKLVDNKTGLYSVVIDPGDPLPEIIPETLQTSLPFRFAYKDVPEFSDFPTDTISNFPEASTSKIILDQSVKKQVVGVYSIKTQTFSTNDELIIENANGYEFLYLLPYIQKIQKTEVALSGRVNFLLEY